MESEKCSMSNCKPKAYIYLVYSIILVIFAVGAYKTIKDRTIVIKMIAIVSIASVFFTIFLICEVVLCLIHLFLYQTLISCDTTMGKHSEHSFWSVVEYHFPLDTLSLTIVIINELVFLGLVITIRRCPLDYALEFGSTVCVWMMMFSFYLITIRKGDLARWKTDLSAMKGLDYGTSMAYNFYYGYLQLTLPSTETGRKGIIEKIENFEDYHNVTFPVHKLFLLIPFSGYIPPDLKEVSYQWMENVHELEEEKRNRAGNIGRTYRNNVYKIYPEGRNSSNNPVYVVVEGATPLLTYYEVQKHNHPDSAVYRQYKCMIIEKFYIKLQEILQSNPETRDLCELIYYDDFDAKRNKVNNVATILLERISEITNSA